MDGGNSSSDPWDALYGKAPELKEYAKPYDPNLKFPARSEPWLSDHVVLALIMAAILICFAIWVSWRWRGRHPIERIDGRSDGWDWNSFGLAACFIILPGALAIVAYLLDS